MIVSPATTGNTRRAQMRSVIASTGTRPSQPTITGTATASDSRSELSPSSCRSDAPSGERSAHARNDTANPTGASVGITPGRSGAVGTAGPSPLVVIVSVITGPSRFHESPRHLWRRAARRDLGPCPHDRPTGTLHM